MPRSSAAKKKAKNAGVGIAFKKAKHKVGKKLPKAQNATDTNFKSKAITLPGQNVGEDKGLAVTSKNHTLKELLALAGHYNGKTRAEALTDLTQLIEDFPNELRKQASTVIEKLSERFVDPEKAVRAALLKLFVSQLLPKLGDGRLVPFLPLLMAHISGAMTHMEENIRVDAMRFLDALVVAAPEQISGQFAIPALQHYTQLLSQAGRSRSLKAGTQKHLLQVLRSLNSFLTNVKTSTADKDTREPSPKRHKTGETTAEHSYGRSTLYQQFWDPPSQLAVSEARQKLQSEILACKGVSAAGPSQNGEVEGKLLESLQGAWKSCAVESHNPEVDVVTLQCMEACTACFILLIKRMATTALGFDVYECTTYVRLVGPYLPMSLPSAHNSAEMQQAVLRLNLAALQFYHILMDSDKMRGGEVEGWIWGLYSYQCGVLARGEVFPVQNDIAANVSQPVVPAEMFTVILSGADKMLRRISEHRQAITEYLDAMKALFMRSKPLSSAKLACLSFIAEVVSNPSRFCSEFNCLIEQDVIASWLQELPKLLWELGRKAPGTSHKALEILRDAGRFHSEHPTIAHAMRQLQDQLSLFFAAEIKDPSRTGPKTKTSIGAEPRAKFVSHLSGLPLATQELAVDLLYYFVDLSPKLLDSLFLICSRPQFTVAVADRVLNVIASQARSNADFSHLKWLCLRLLGLTPQEPQSKGPPGCKGATDAGRISDVVEMAVQALTSCDQGQMLGELDVDFVRILESPDVAHNHRHTLSAILRLSELNCAHTNACVPDESEQGEPPGDTSAASTKQHLPQNLSRALPSALCRLVSETGELAEEDPQHLRIMVDLLVQHPDLLSPFLLQLMSTNSVSSGHPPLSLRHSAGALKLLCSNELVRPPLARHREEIQQAAQQIGSRMLSTSDKATQRSCQQLKSVVGALFES